MRSGRTISRYSPRKPCSSGPSSDLCVIRHEPPGRKSISQLATSYLRGPHQLLMCSHELCASNTRSRGASNVRVMTISRSDGVVTLSLLSAIAVFLSSSLELFQVLVQPVVSLFPETAVMISPIRNFLERFRLQPSRPPLPLPAPRDEPGSLQHLQMLGDRRQADIERRRQFQDRRLA